MKVFEVTINTDNYHLGSQEAADKAVENLKTMGLSDNIEKDYKWTKEGFHSILDCSTIVISQEQLVKGMELGLEIKVKRTIEVSPDLGYDLQESIQSMVDKTLSQLTSTSSNVYNNKCEVHMSNFALMHYNETLLIQDGCTDVLQESLTEGWRLIAACPQPDQRRPDYILGRYSPDLDLTEATRAKRSPL